MPRQPAAIDTDKLRAAVRRLGSDHVIFFADEGGSWQVGVGEGQGHERVPVLRVPGDRPPSHGE